MAVCSGLRLGIAIHLSNVQLHITKGQKDHRSHGSRGLTVVRGVQDCEAGEGAAQGVDPDDRAAQGDS